MAQTDLLVHARLVRQTARPAKEIQADFAAIKKSADETGKATTKQVREMDKLGREMNRLTRQQREFAEKLKHTGSQLTVGLTLPIVAGLGMATKKFSDLNEAADAAFRTLGKGYDRIGRLAANANKELGLSKRAVNEYAASFGGLLRTSGVSEGQASSMAEQLIRRGVDLGSKWNRSNEDVAQALSSGLVGEAEPLRRLGVLLSEARVKQEAYASGIAKTGAELTEAQKVQARFNLIMRDSAKDAGNFAATHDSIANKAKTAQATLENLGATYGERLAPIVSELLDKSLGLLEFFTDLPGPVQTATIALLGLAAVAGPILTLAGNLRVLQLTLAAGGLTSGAGGLGGLLGAGGLSGAFAAGGLAIPAIGVGTAMIAYGVRKQESEADQKAVDRANERYLSKRPGDKNIGSLTARMQTATRERAYYANAQRILQARYDELKANPEKDDMGFTTAAHQKRLGDLAAEIERTARAAKAIDPVVGALGLERAGMLAEGQAAAEMAKLAGSTEDVAAATDRVGSRFESAQSRMSRFFDVYRRSIQGARDDLRDLGSAWDESMGRFLGRDSNELAFQRTVQSAVESMKGTDRGAKQSSIIDIFSGAQSSAQWLLDNGYITADQLSATTFGYLQKASAQLGNLDPDIQAQWDAYIAEMYRWAADVSRMAIADTYDAIQRTTPSVSRNGMLPRSRNVPIGDSPWSVYRGPVLGHDGALAGTLGMYGGLSAGLGTRISNALIGQHPGSDHFRGRALDLVGSGLPAMQARLIAAGGRAEFHGLGAGRHLHTVYPAGDSAHGYSSSMDRRSGTTVVDIGGITVHAASGQQASEVVDELERRVRSAKERGVPWP